VPGASRVARAPITWLLVGGRGEFDPNPSRTLRGGSPFGNFPTSRRSFSEFALHGIPTDNDAVRVI
jgi:hypothetical protein